MSDLPVKIKNPEPEETTINFRPDEKTELSDLPKFIVESLGVLAIYAFVKVLNSK